MRVRRLRSNEIDAYRTMRLRALQLAPYAFGGTYESALARTEEEWRELVARAAESDALAGFVLDRGDGTLAGSAFVGPSWDERSEHPEVSQMWLDEDLRGTGWADALLEAAERFALDLGATAVELWVYEANPRARRFYARLGYVSTGVDADWGSGRAELLRKTFPRSPPPTAQ